MEASENIPPPPPEPTHPNNSEGSSSSWITSNNQGLPAPMPEPASPAHQQSLGKKEILGEGLSSGTSKGGAAKTPCLEVSASPVSAWHPAHPTAHVQPAQPLESQVDGCVEPTAQHTPPWYAPSGAEGPMSMAGEGFQAQCLEPILFFGKLLANQPGQPQPQLTPQLGRPLTPAEVASAPSVRVGSPPPALEESSDNSTGAGTPSPRPALTILEVLKGEGLNHQGSDADFDKRIVQQREEDQAQPPVPYQPPSPSNPGTPASPDVRQRPDSTALRTGPPLG